jgi:hypothetical protein
VTDVLSAPTIPADDERAYAVASSVTELLLAFDADPQRLLTFGQFGAEHGWDAALQKYYGIANVDRLQMIWQDAAKKKWSDGGLE